MNQQLTINKQVVLKPYKARPFKQYELGSKQDLIDGAGGTLIVDTENYANYFLIAFKNIKTKKVFKLEINNEFVDNGGSITNWNSNKLFWIMYNYKTIGFNSLKYDLPLIWLSHHTQNFHTLKNASNWLVREHYHKETFEHEYNIKLFKTDHIDLIEICPGIHSLKLYMGRLHSQRIQDVPFDPDSKLTLEQIEIVSDYCVNDLNGTEELYLFNKERINLREELGKEYKVDLRSKSDAQMAEAMVRREIYNKTSKWPKKANLTEKYSFKYNSPKYLKFASSQLQKLFYDVCNTEFTVNCGQLNRPEIFENYCIKLNDTEYKFGIGGLHSREKNISYKSNEEYEITDKDVTGYYPNIIITLGLYPEHLGISFLEVFNKMKTDREYAKKNKLFTKNKGLKIATNGISGKFNSEHSIFFSPRTYLHMTLTGQLSILMLAEIFEYNDMRIISANTDGIVIYHKKSDYDKLAYWINYWENLVEFKTEETKYEAYYARDVNTYFALKKDGTVKVKGPYREIGSQTGTKLDNNPIVLICSDAAKELISKQVPIEKTILECKDITRFITVRNVKGGAHKNGEYLGKVCRWYYGKNEYGTINYIVSGNKVPDTEGAIPCLDLPNELPTDINYEWYINRTRELLQECNYISRPKQLKFF